MVVAGILVSPIETLKGTARTLDKADGSIPLEDGIISRNGIALLDDSQGFIWDEQSGYIERENQIDLYFFAYGHDYRGAIRDFYPFDWFNTFVTKICFR